MYNVVEYKEIYKEKLINLIEKVFVEEFKFEEHRKYIQNLDFNYSKNHNERCWIVINENDEVIGTISCLNKNIEECYLKYFYLNELHRGKGISKKLFETFLEFVQLKSYKKIYLGTYEKLERAVAFYKKNGFIEYENEFAKEGEKYFYKEC